MENTNRSHGALAAAAFRLGSGHMDTEKLQEAIDLYTMLSKYDPEYKKQLAAAQKIQSSLNGLRDSIRNMAKKK